MGWDGIVLSADYAPLPLYCKLQKNDRIGFQIVLGIWEFGNFRLLLSLLNGKIGSWAGFSTPIPSGGIASRHDSS
jgi:hypothetical protein